MSDRELEAGPELDVVIHTEIMGYPRNWPITRDPKYLYVSIDGEWIRQEPPPYSRDIATAMQVAEKMVADGWDVTIENTNMNEIEGEPMEYAWGVYFNYFTDNAEDFKHASAEVDSFEKLPEAICQAAVMAAEAE